MSHRADHREGFEALIRIGERRPDMLIMDLRMPGMDGFRMLEALRTNPKYRTLQLIVVTALSREEIQAHGDLRNSRLGPRHDAGERNS